MAFCSRVKALCRALLMAFPMVLLPALVGASLLHKDPIRVGVTASFVSDRGADIYPEIVEYIQSRINREVKFVTGFSDSTINNMLINGVIDFGFVDGLFHLTSNDQEVKTKLVVAPIMAYERYADIPKYFSYIVVRRDSDYTAFSELKGSRFVYNYEGSNPGYNMPRAKLVELGEVNGFFDSLMRSGSHEQSMRMVAAGEADVGAIDSLVYDFESYLGSNYVDRLKIIEILGPAGIPPFVASVEVEDQVVVAMRNALVGMHQDPEGLAILERVKVKRFINVDSENYADIDAYRKMAEKREYLTIK